MRIYALNIALNGKCRGVRSQGYICAQFQTEMSAKQPIKSICIIGTAWPFRGGLSAMNERLAEAFEQNGYEVEIITFTVQYPSVLFPGKTQMDDRPKPKLRISRELNSINPLSWLKVGMAIKNKKPDLVVIKYWMAFMAPCFGTVLRLIKQNRHSRVVSILDNLIPHERHLFDTVLNRYFVSPVDGFIALSQSVLNDVAAFDPDKPRKLSPHPVYDSFGSILPKVDARKILHLDPDGKYLLFFGFIRDYKGLDLLIEAMADARIGQSNIKLIIAGEYYANEEKYSDLIQKHGVQSRLVLHTKFIPDHEIGHYFNACDCVVQPYKTATQSGVTQIAYHFQKPMIVTNVGGLPEIVPHEKVGLVCEVKPESIADAILNFFSGDPERYRGEIALKAKAYSWDTMVNNVLSLVD